MSESTTANRADVEHRIRALFLEALNIGIDSVDTDLIETSQLDSLVLVELLLLLEKEFDIDVVVAELDIDDFRTVRTIGAFVTRLRTGEGVR
jgi:methoxymalonate biosynthesis acyl carrier protein